MHHLLSINQFTKNDILNLVSQTAAIKASPQNYSDKLAGKIVATLFFEPSTRTRLSFESAALRLGAKVLGFADAGTSSTKKGETLEDTIKIVNGFANLIVMRHPKSGAAQRAAKVSSIPIINGGDGINEHPTQALLDIFTIAEEITPPIRRAGKIQDTRYKQRQAGNIQYLNNLKIAFVGDLKYGRTVHSLSQGMAHFNPTYYFISPPTLKLPDEIKQKLTEQGTKFQELETWNDIAGEVDALYMTRMQKERFDDIAEYERLKDVYVLTAETAAKFNSNCLFMHPLPRVGEIDPAVDNDPRAIYFKEAHNGVWMRMALLLLIFNS
ncbi:MAG: aspartate carbamoyltransferase [Candidatus Jacksonbacteria bacterium]